MENAWVHPNSAMGERSPLNHPTAIQLCDRTPKLRSGQARGLSPLFLKAEGFKLK
ncbi:hypothetical protein [Spirulina sp.]|uniref:hypothetical protein n=1 Tax=Spirulina sp. TaxID=1157 RepID=UPI003F7203F9